MASLREALIRAELAHRDLREEAWEASDPTLFESHLEAIVPALEEARTSIPQYASAADLLQRDAESLAGRAEGYDISSEDELWAAYGELIVAVVE